MILRKLSIFQLNAAPDVIKVAHQIEAQNGVLPTVTVDRLLLHYPQYLAGSTSPLPELIPNWFNRSLSLHQRICGRHYAN